MVKTFTVVHKMPHYLLIYYKISIKVIELCRHLNKRYFIKDQQIARNFVHYSESLYPPHSLLTNATKKNNPFLTSKILANHDKGCLILANREILILLNVVLV